MSAMRADFMTLTAAELETVILGYRGLGLSDSSTIVLVHPSDDKLSRGDDTLFLNGEVRASASRQTSEDLVLSAIVSTN